MFSALRLPAGYFCVALVAAGCAVPVAAQTVGPTRQELELPHTAPSTVSGGVTVDRNATVRAPCPFDASNLTAEVKRVVFTSPASDEVPVELAQTLAQVRAPEGPQPLAAVCAVRDAANDALRRAGWLATVQIPPQELVDTLQLQVIPARIVEVQIDGNPGPYADLVRGRLLQLRQLDPVNERDVERILLQAGDIPGLTLRLTLAPAGGEPGAVVGRAAVAYASHAGFLNAQNYASRQTGRETLFGRFEYYGLTGLADRTYVGAQTTLDFDEQKVVQVGHEFAPRGGNLRVAGNLTLGWSRPAIAGLAVKTRSLIANLEGKVPLARSLRSRADLALGFDLIDQQTTIGPVPLFKDAIRALYARATTEGRQLRYDGSVALAYNASLELRRGLGVLGATRASSGIAATDGVPASRPFGSATATVLRGGSDVFAALGSVLGVRARAEGQWADQPVLSYDEFAVGNFTIGRGYDPGVSTGDHAIAGSLEVSGNAVRRPDATVQVFGFYDVARIANLDFGTTDKARTLASVGAGTRLFLGTRVSAEVTYARPLDTAQTGAPKRPPDRLLLSLTTKFPA